MWPGRQGVKAQGTFQHLEAEGRQGGDVPGEAQQMVKPEG